MQTYDGNKTLWNSISEKLDKINNSEDMTIFFKDYGVVLINMEFLGDMIIVTTNNTKRDDEKKYKIKRTQEFIDKLNLLKDIFSR